MGDVVDERSQRWVVLESVGGHPSLTIRHVVGVDVVRARVVPAVVVEDHLDAFHRAGIESKASEIHAAFQEALDSGSLSPAQAQFAKNSLQAERRLIDLADEYL